MMFSTVLLFVSFSCSTTPITLAQNCDVRLEDLSSDVASPSDTVRGTGGPMTMVWDTVVYVGETRAESVSLQREGCEECDDCKEENQCSACDDCDACDALCTDTCIESIDFVVPALSPGQFEVSFYNGHGQSNSIPLGITNTSDTGTGGDSADPIDTGTP